MGAKERVNELLTKKEISGLDDNEECELLSILSDFSGDQDRIRALAEILKKIIEEPRNDILKSHVEEAYLILHGKPIDWPEFTSKHAYMPREEQLK